MHKSSLGMFRNSLMDFALLSGGVASAQTAICYNCPPEWADWGTQLKAIKEKTGITVPPDNKNSGQSLAQLVAEKNSPVADVTYLGVTFGIQGYLGQTHGLWTVAEQFLAPFGHHAVELRIRHGAVDPAKRRRIRRRTGLAEQDDFLGAALADNLREQLGAVPDGCIAEP